MIRVTGRPWRLISIIVMMTTTVVVQAAETNGFSRDELARKVGQVVQTIRSIDLYRESVVPQPNAEIAAKSCRDLEYELAALQPKTYSYKPNFYDDPVQGTAVWVSATAFWPLSYGVLGYTGYYEYQENERIYKAQDRIEMLRRAKAEKHCFES
jgi:hypothetical protein